MLFRSIPSPYVPNNHQVLNAKSLSDSGAALMIEEKDMNADRLVSEITALIQHPERLVAMGKAAKTLGKPDAAEDMIGLMEKILKGN